MAQTSIEGIVEAALFSAGAAVTAGDIARATGLTAPQVNKAMKKLMAEYSEKGALEIVKVGTGYMMRVKKMYAGKIMEIAPTELSKATIKTAALIAYYQPMTQANLKNMVGSAAYKHIHELEELGLIKVKPKGSTKSLTTTKHFLEYFGIDAKNQEEMKAWLKGKI
jgi:segregation and condensation protein B